MGTNKNRMRWPYESRHFGLSIKYSQRLVSSDKHKTTNTGTELLPPVYDDIHPDQLEKVSKCLLSGKGKS